MMSINKILLIDDDPVQLAILDTYFSSKGVDVLLKAANGVSALKLIGEHTDTIDLVLCDLKMPEMDGIEFMRHLKDSSYGGPIAILSSADRFLIESAEKLAAIHGLKVIGSVRKPINRQKLDTLLDKIVESASPAGAMCLPPLDRAFLARAIDDGHIVPWYQPKTAINSRQVVGVEALARWIHPELGIISPAIFIPLAEREGLIGQLTDCIISGVISDVQAWLAHGINVKIAINVTAEILQDVEFPDKLLNRLELAGIDKSRFILEVTESGVIDANAASMEVLTRLRIKDVDISIDDFGTGFSNIEQLKKFPYSELKVDQTFISNGASDTFSDVSVRASVTLGRELNMRLVAEGVETREQWDYVAGHGIDQVQGFFVARPMPATEFQAWYLACDGVVDIGESDLGDVDIYAPLIDKATG